MTTKNPQRISSQAPSGFGGGLCARGPLVTASAHVVRQVRPHVPHDKNSWRPIVLLPRRRRASIREWSLNRSHVIANPPDQRAGLILVIDDEMQIRRAVRNALAPLSERVLEAATGSAGLDLAASERPDLVILDLALPDMAGVDVCRDIRAWSRIPIIVLSARQDRKSVV